MNHTFRILLHQFKTRHKIAYLAYSQLQCQKRKKKKKKKKHPPICQFATTHFGKYLVSWDTHYGNLPKLLRAGMFYSVDPRGSDVNTLVASCSLPWCHDGTSLQRNTSCYCCVPQVQQGKKSPVCWHFLKMALPILFVTKRKCTAKL